MRPSFQFFLAAVGLGAVAISAWGCTIDEEIPFAFAVNTAVAVIPSEFLLGVPCAPGEGAMKSFVAVVTDRGPVDGDGNTPVGYAFELPASPPTPCTESVAFRYVTLGHRYEARIQAYDIPAQALTPAAADIDGPCATEPSDKQNKASPPQVKPAVGSSQVCWNPSGAEGGPFALAEPSWERSCGTQGFGAAVPRAGVEVRIRGCVSSGDNGSVGVGETQIVVDPVGALGTTLSCFVETDEHPEADPTEIESFDVLPQDSSLPDVVGLVCASGKAVFPGVEPGQSYAFRVEGGNADSPARWATNCNATAFEGVAVTASCDTLTDRGALRISLGDCPTGGTYHLSAVNAESTEVLLLGDGGCTEGPVSVGNIPAGRYDVTVSIDVPDAEPTELGCQATVVAASTTDVDCTDPTPADD